MFSKAYEYYYGEDLSSKLEPAKTEVKSNRYPETGNVKDIKGAERDLLSEIDHAETARISQAQNVKPDGLINPGKPASISESAADQARIPEAGVKVEAENIQPSTVKISSRGIEGTLIDLVKNDPQSATAKWLEKEYPGMDYKSAIHKKVLELAKENGYSVDGAGNDLSDLAKGNIVVNSDGSFSLEKESLDFIEQKSPTPQAMADNMDRIEYAPHIGPENLENESLDFEQLKGGQVADIISDESSPDVPASETYSAADKEAAFEKTYDELSSKKKTSDALKELMQKQYKQFMKEDLNLDARSLNKIQSLKTTEFMSFYTNNETSPALLKEYKGLADTINKYLENGGYNRREDFKEESIRKILLRIAAERIGK